MPKNTGLIIFTLIAIAIVLIIARIFQWSEPEKIVVDFTSCTEAGFPVIKTYPRQCIDKNQKKFLEVISLQATGTNTKIIKTLIPINTTSTNPKTATSSDFNLKNYN